MPLRAQRWTPRGAAACYFINMQAACIHCGQQHSLKDDALGVHPKVQFRCSKCGLVTVVEIKRRVDATMVISPMPSFARAEATSSNLHLPPADDGLRLPAMADIVLAVISGPSKGAVHTLKNPRAIIGRKGADVALEDAEISRQHCLIEVRDRYVNLKDLDSTNGTFFDEERVRAAVLLDGAEFRVGTSIIRVNIQPK
jgi:Inner membrane component of T3SS, cytoplasmic domain